MLHEQKKAIAEGNEAAKEKREKAPKVMVVAEVNIPDGIITRKTREDTTSEQQYQRRTLALSFVSILIVLSLAYLAYLQWGDMNEANFLTFKALRDAKISRRQTNEALKASIDQFHLDQRAWVGPTGHTTLIISEGEKLAYSIIIQNSGKTPALKMHTNISGNSVAKGTPFTFSYEPPNTIRSESVLQPNATSFLAPEGKTSITQGNINALKSGDYILYFYGRIDYRDVFGEKIHITTFCQYVMPDLKTVNNCSVYNTAD